MSVTSDEVNFLVHRYLLESGFTHAAFVFGHESYVTKTNIDGNAVPPGALISFIQKGLQYLEMEANIAAEEQAATKVDFSVLSAHDLITKDIEELKLTVMDQQERAEQERQAQQQGQEERGRDSTAAARQDGAAAGSDIPASQVTTLAGHTNEVFICAWSPTAPLLASGSGDSTARIWDLSTLGQGGEVRSEVLKHTKGKNAEQSKDVTTLDWNGDGSLLATGSYDGIARIWSKDGELRSTLVGHKGPIFSLKWNKKGDLLLSGSVDKTAIVWDGRSGEAKQQFEFHSAPTLDVDWKNNNTFATCSSDKMIFVCKVGEAQPLKSFQGHGDEVNAIKWDPTGKVLASCSDDQTAKVWSLQADQPIHTFAEHSKEIYTIKWSHSGPGTSNPTLKALLATASFDHTIRLWDVEAGGCLHTLTAHTQPVYSVSFSPNGRFLASGSFDKTIHIWSLKDGGLIKTYTGAGGIFEVCWSKDGDKVAACFSDKTVLVIDLRL